MHQRATEGEGGENTLPSGVDESPSPDPAGGQQYLATFDARVVESWTKYEHHKGVRQHYKHKGRWSKFLMCSILGMIVYQMVVLVLVGTDVLDFAKYDWLLPGLLVQNLGQIVGLAIYAVKHLFSDITVRNGS